MQLFLALIVSLAVLGTISADPGSCTLQLQETAVQNIFAGVDALVDASVRGLRAYANQAKLFHSSMRKAPDNVNDVDNPAQKAMYTISEFHEHVYVYGGWEDNTFVGYFPGTDKSMKVWFQEPDDAGYSVYNINEMGSKTGSAIKTDDDYKCTERDWYKLAKNACDPNPPDEATATRDINNYFDCPVVMADLYVSVVDNEITLTPTLGMPNWNGNPTLSYLETGPIMPYGGQNDPDTTPTVTQGASAYSGAIAADVPCFRFNEVLEEVTKNGATSVAYIMEQGFNLVAVSDGSKVYSDTLDAFDRPNLLAATMSATPDIKDSAAYMKANQMYSDNVVVWTDKSTTKTITVKKYFKNGLKWFIVAVAPYSAAVAANCDFKVLSATLSDVSHAVDMQLSYAVNGANLVAGAIKYTQFTGAQAKPAWSAEGLWNLGASAANADKITIQNALITLGVTFPEVIEFYVAYPKATGEAVDTFISYVMDGTGKFNTFNYLGSGTEEVRNGYYVAPLLGYASQTKKLVLNDYVPSGRPWYKAAVAKKKGTWGAPYIFVESNVVGLTYSVPVYDENDVLLAVIGTDFTLADVTKTLQGFGTSGDVFYAMETNQSPTPDSPDDKPELCGTSADYNLLATSSEANIVNGQCQADAYNTLDVSDSMISNSATYMKEKGITYDGNFKAGNGGVLHGTVLNYENYGLHWRFVGVSYQFPMAATSNNASPNPSPSPPKPSGSDGVANDTSIDANIQKLTIAVLCIVCFQLLLTLATLARDAKKDSIPPVSSSTENPINNRL